MRELILKHKKTLILFAIFMLVIGAIAVWLGWEYREPLKQFSGEARVWAMEQLRILPPLAFIVVFGLAPLAMFPISILYLSAGAYGVMQGLLMVWLGLAINITLGYWIANSFLRKWIILLARKLNYTIPTAVGGGAVKLSLVVRIVPGLPFGMQNYFLGLAGVPFRIYFPISFIVQGIIATVMVTAGGAALHGNYGMALTAVGVFVIVSIIISLLRKRYVRVDAKTKAGA